MISMQWNLLNPTQSMTLLHANLSYICVVNEDIYGLMQERRNSSALAIELRLSCTSPSI